MSSLGVKAGDEIRTHNIQLGSPGGEHSKHLPIQGDTSGVLPVVPKSVPSEHENTPEPHDVDHLAVIADLLVGLSQPERQEVIAELVPADRVAITRLLIGERNSPGTR